VTRSILGPAPIVDFDGTLTCLVVEWGDLRTRLRVDRIGRLWESKRADAWAHVRDAEVEAARHATPFEPMRAAIAKSTAFAVLTSNSEDAVAEFLRRFEALQSRVAVVVGRETLAGPKYDYEVFRRGFMTCVQATAPTRTDGPVVYTGDQAWELEFARRLGAKAFDVHELRSSS
jgi:phosphoglycolate phosphatase-like HAD superfamily hydrolase